MNTELIGAVLRSTRWGPQIISGVLGVAVVAVPIVAGQRLDLLDTTMVVHLGMFAMLLGSAFVFDDPALDITEGLPVSARRVALIRMAGCTCLLALFWLVILWIAPAVAAGSVPYPRPGLLVEPFAVAPWIWAVAIRTGRRRPRGDGSSVAAPLVFFVGVGASMLPDQFSLLVSPGAPDYADSRMRWLAVAIGGLLALAATRRPARPSNRRLLNR